MHALRRVPRRNLTRELTELGRGRRLVVVVRVTPVGPRGRVADRGDHVEVAASRRRDELVEPGPREHSLLGLDRVPAIPDPATSRFYLEDFPQTSYDFFPYSGLHRPVLLFTTPATHVHDVSVVTTRAGSNGVVEVSFTVAGDWSGPARLTIWGAKEPIRVPVQVSGGRGRNLARPATASQTTKGIGTSTGRNPAVRAMVRNNSS